MHHSIRFHQNCGSSCVAVNKHFKPQISQTPSKALLEPTIFVYNLCWVSQYIYIFQYIPLEEGYNLAQILRLIVLVHVGFYLSVFNSINNNIKNIYIAL